MHHLHPLHKLIRNESSWVYLLADPNFKSYLYGLNSFFPKDLMKDFCTKFGASSLENPIKLSVKPNDLLLAYKQFSEVKLNNGNRAAIQFTKKFKNLNGDADKLADVLAELEVAALICPHYKFELNHKTGKGLKDTDLFIPAIGLSIEVKNYQHGRSKFEKKVASEIQKIDAEGQEGHYITTTTGMRKINSTPGILSVNLQAYNPSKQIISYLDKAHEKISINESAIIFITGMGITYMEKWNLVIKEWSKTKSFETGIKSVVIASSHRDFENRRQTWHIKLSYDPVVSSFLNSIDLI